MFHNQILGNAQTLVTVASQSLEDLQTTAPFKDIIIRDTDFF